MSMLELCYSLGLLMIALAGLIAWLDWVVNMPRKIETSYQYEVAGNNVKVVLCLPGDNWERVTHKAATRLNDIVGELEKILNEVYPHP